MNNDGTIPNYVNNLVVSDLLKSPIYNNFIYYTFNIELYMFFSF